jgi:hypothetical protein
MSDTRPRRLQLVANILLALMVALGAIVVSSTGVSPRT